MSKTITRSKSTSSKSQRSGRWHSVQINGIHIVNRATRKLADHVENSCRRISAKGYLCVKAGGDGTWEVWLTKHADVNSPFDIYLECYMRRGGAERLARKIATALRRPCVTYHAELD